MGVCQGLSARQGQHGTNVGCRRCPHAADGTIKCGIDMDVAPKHALCHRVIRVVGNLHALYPPRPVRIPSSPRAAPKAAPAFRALVRTLSAPPKDRRGHLTASAKGPVIVTLRDTKNGSPGMPSKSWSLTVSEDGVTCEGGACSWRGPGEFAPVKSCHASGQGKGEISR